MGSFGRIIYRNEIISVEFQIKNICVRTCVCVCDSVMELGERQMKVSLCLRPSRSEGFISKELSCFVVSEPDGGEKSWCEEEDGGREDDGGGGRGLGVNLGQEEKRKTEKEGKERRREDREESWSLEPRLQQQSILGEK